MHHVAAFSSARQDWETPQSLFDYLDAQYGFTLDAAASHDTAKCADYYTVEDDALTKRWEGVVFCNPPYSHGIGKWVEKARLEAVKGATVVMPPAGIRAGRDEHDHVMKARHIVLIRGRLRFGGSSINAPFPSCVVVFDQFHRGNFPLFTAMDRMLDQEIAS